jgi:elongation factor Ts
MVTAQMVKELRAKTGAGVLDCQKALKESNGDMDSAVDLLRKKGLAAASKKSGRTTNEGMMFVRFCEERKKFTMISLLCETDFVARTDEFQNSGKALVEALSHSMEEVEGGPVDESVREAHKQKLTESIAKIGENIQLGDYCHWMGDAQSTIAYYIHHNGKIGVGVELTSSKIATELSELAKKISLHIAAASPEYLDPASVPEAVIQKEREIYTDQMKESGKPMPVIEKIVEGKIAKFYEDRCVMNQKYALDPDHSIPSMLEDVSKKIGAPVAFKRFARFMIGE